jgi:hypothetical protein
MTEPPIYWYGQKTVKQKIKPKIIPRTIVLEDIKDKCSSTAYFRTVSSLVRFISKHFGWDDTKMVIADYEDNYDEIVKLILDNYTIRDHTGLTSKMATIAYPMKLVGYDGNFIQKRKQLLQLPIELKPADKDIPDWDVMKNTIIKKAFDDTLHPGGKIVCLAYAQGYPLRLHEIVNTTTDRSKKDKMNYLDIYGNEWFITSEHSKTRVHRQFKVTKEFTDSIKPFLNSIYLISRKNGEPYTTTQNVTLRQLGIQAFTVNGVRNSFETWNYNRDASDEEKHRVSIDVLGHQPSTALANYTRNDLACELTKKIT